MKDDLGMVMPQGINDILQAAQEEYEMVTMETPELRRWALDMAFKAGAKEGSILNPISLAQTYINYVLKGEK